MSVYQALASQMFVGQRVFDQEVWGPLVKYAVSCLALNVCLPSVQMSVGQKVLDQEAWSPLVKYLEARLEIEVQDRVVFLVPCRSNVRRPNGFRQKDVEPDKQRYHTSLSSGLWYKAYYWSNLRVCTIS